MQTLKRPIVKPKPEDVIEELEIQLKSVRHNFKPTVQTRRALPQNDEDKDEEKELSIREQEEEIEKLLKFFPATRDLLKTEIHSYKSVFDNAVKNYGHKNEYVKNDQDDLKKSDEILDKKMLRFARLENISKSLNDEIKVIRNYMKNNTYLKKYNFFFQAIVKKQERQEKTASEKLKSTVQKYREVINYLEHELDFQRKTHDDTLELFRKLEKTLRDTIYRCENAEDRVLVLQEELNKTKTELHCSKNKLYEEVRNCQMPFISD